MSEHPRSSSSSAIAVVTAPATSLDEVLREVRENARDVRAVRSLMSQFLDNAEFERKQAQVRHDAVMDILRDLIVRVPDTSPSVPPTTPA